MPTLVICAPTGYFADDIKATCARCGAGVVHRPHVPADSVKICIPCGARELRRNKGAVVDVTDDTLREASLYFQRTKGVQ